MNKVLKVLLIILGVLALVFIIAMLVFKSYLNLNTKELSPNEKILEGNSGKKALVLYQKSKHESATNITMALAEELNKNGYTVVINHPSSKLSYKVEDYDLLAFGSAVYMGSVSEPLKKFIEEASFNDKNVIVYTVGGSLEEKADVEGLKEKVKGAKKVDGIKVKKGEEERIKEFVRKFINN